MRSCKVATIMKNKSCDQCDCRLWIDYEEDLNCTLIAAEKNGPMNLREVADRLGISFVRVKQIQDTAMQKLSLKKESLKAFCKLS
tara:strand:+ start:201 stop:455 length:255 start_codon:yes stop_codon:yes gene_type:complete